MAERYQATDSDNKKVEYIERHYFTTEADKFVECASIGFHRSADRSGYVLKDLYKKPEGNGDYVFIGFTGENMDVYISSPVMFLIIRTEGEEVNSFGSNISVTDFEGNYEEEETEACVDDIKEQPWNIRAVESDLNFEYDDTADAVVITVSKNGEKKRIMRMNVRINVKNIRGGLFPVFCLDDPYNTRPSDDDWIYKDLVKEIGVVDV